MDFSGLNHQSKPFIMLMNVKTPKICLHFNIYEQDKFDAQLNRA